MATVDEILATMPEVDAKGATDEMLIINPDTRQISVPGVELIFGVVSDTHAERKYFLAPRYVGNNVDLASCFVRVNYRNANGKIDSCLVNDVAVTEDGAYVMFSWELTRNVTAYKGQVTFVVCACLPGSTSVWPEWHTTQATGVVLEGLEPDAEAVEAATKDVITQLLTLVDAQTANVESAGAAQVTAVQSEGATQVEAVKTAAKAAESASVSEIEAKGVNTRESIPDDYTALSEAVDGLVRSRAGAIVCEAAGSAVSVSDASDNYIQGLRIFGRSTQDGTPTPEAPVEIVSVEKPVVTVCGANLIPWPYADGMSKEMNGITFTVQSDGSVLVNGTATALAYFSFSYTSGQHPLPQGWLCVSSGLGYDGDVQVQNDIYVNGEYSTAVQTVLENAAKRQFTEGKITLGASRIKVNSGATVSNVVVYPMLCCGETVQPYEKSKVRQTLSTTQNLPGIPVTSGGNYTDSDGQQWICDEVDLERGVYVQRVKKFVLSELKKETWYTWGVNHSTDGFTGFYHYFIDDVVSDIVLSNIGLYSKMAWGGVGSGVSASADGNYFMVSVANTNLVDATTDEKAVASFISLLEEMSAYILAAVAPIETPLSETEIAAYRALHSNYPNTTVLNDSGAHMVVKYAADTKLYIDNKIAALIGG